MNERMARTSKRTDPHRPGAIIPAHYEYVFSFNCATTQDGWPVPSFRVNCELDRRHDVPDGSDGKVRTVNGEHDLDGNCCVIGLRQIRKERFALDGGPGHCTVCGAHYVYGDCWRHIPTGELIFLGHDCAEKYALLADRSEAELAALRAKEGAARAANAERTRIALQEYYAAHPGLEAALSLTPPAGLSDRELGKFYILSELKDKLRQYRVLSDKQLALALRLAAEIQNPAPAEVQVPAPTGKQTFRGVVVSTRVQDGAWGSSIKMTVKVTTPEGVWLAWGTEPAALMSETSRHTNRNTKGCEVEITATLKAGREPHFAIMGRPRGKIVRFSCEKPETCEGCQRLAIGDAAYELQEFIRHQRSKELRSREQGFFDQAIYAQWFADEAERTGKLPAIDLSGRTPDYVWYRAHEGRQAW